MLGLVSLNRSTMPSGTFEGTNVPKKKTFSSMKKTLELMSDVIVFDVDWLYITTYSSKIDSYCSVLIPGMQLSLTTS